MDRFWSKVMKDEGCWLWTAATFARQQGPRYGQFKWLGRPRLAHRVAWELTFGPIPEGLDVLHTCDNRLCCNPEHLFLGDEATNTADRVAKGRSAVEFALPQTKLSDADTAEVRRLYAAGTVSQRQIAQQFHVSQPQVQRILAGTRR